MPLSETRLLAKLKENLGHAGFNESVCRKQLGSAPEVFLSGPELLYVPDLPYYLWRCRERDASAQACVFWLLHQPMASSWLESQAGASGLDWLLKRELVTLSGSEARANSDLTPCGGAYFWHSPRVDPGEARPEAIPPIDARAHWRYWLAPRRLGQRALDLCSGVGAGAILAAGHCESVVAIETSPEAIAFARLNATFNEVSPRCQFLPGQLYDQVSGQVFDRIQACLPCYDILSGGQAREFPRRIVAGLPEHLAPGGLLSMFQVYELAPSECYAEQVQSWLAEASPQGNAKGWGVTVLRFASLAVERHLGQQLSIDSADYVANLEKSLGFYLDRGVESVVYAIVLIERLQAEAAEHPGYAVELNCRIPETDMSAAVGMCTEALRRYHDPGWDWNRWKPDWGPYLSQLSTNAAGTRGRLDSTFAGLFFPFELDAAGVELCRAISGRRTAADLVRLWAAKHHVDSEQARREVWHRLRALALRLFLKEIAS